jgi:hypothetical protein
MQHKSEVNLFGSRCRNSIINRLETILGQENSVIGQETVKEMKKRGEGAP